MKTPYPTNFEKATVAIKRETIMTDKAVEGDAMEVCIRIPPRYYERLWSRIPEDSRAREAIEKATCIHQASDGVLSEGYSIPCDENQARILLAAAVEYCPEVVPDIEKALARGVGN
jgi:hypothetical protein